ncbi:hypothetical protein D3C80_2139120 [compost metagenome]
MTEVAQEPEPDLLFRQAAPHDVTGEVGVGPKADQVAHVADGDGGQGQAVGRENGHIKPNCLKLATPSRPTMRWSWT